MAEEEFDFRKTMQDEFPTDEGTDEPERRTQEEPQNLHRGTIIVQPENVPLADAPPASVLGNMANAQKQQPQKRQPQKQQRRPPVERAPVVSHADPFGPQFYRSANRQPSALLIALDDGSDDEGEEVRIRVPQFVIGRTKGECVIGHDIDMSGRHAKINCLKEAGEYKWELTDLKSTNGTFLRVRRAVLRSGRELIIGDGRYIFRSSGQLDTISAPKGEVSNSIQNNMVNVHGSVGSSADHTNSGKRSFVFSDHESWFGADSSCEHFIGNDPFLDGRHCKIYRDYKNRLVIQDNHTLNGLWARIGRITLDNNARFLLGGQRFLFRVL